MMVPSLSVQSVVVLTDGTARSSCDLGPVPARLGASVPYRPSCPQSDIAHNSVYSSYMTDNVGDQPLEAITSRPAKV